MKCLVDFITVLAVVALVSLAGLSGGLLMLRNEKKAKHLSLHMVSFAAGALLGAVFLDILPEAMEIGVLNTNFFIYILAGIVIFYVLEKFLFLYHCHAGKCDVHTYAYLAILGDTVHNFIDGVLIAASFLVSLPLGIVTALAVFFHEIPQEVGDFSILLHAGMKKNKIIMYNILSALAAVAGAAIGYYFLNSVSGLTNIMLAFVAGNFIYIAGVDLIPETTKDKEHMRSFTTLALFLSGILMIYLAGKLIA